MFRAKSELSPTFFILRYGRLNTKAINDDYHIESMMNSLGKRRILVDQSLYFSFSVILILLYSYPIYPIVYTSYQYASA